MMVTGFCILYRTVEMSIPLLVHKITIPVHKSLKPMLELAFFPNHVFCLSCNYLLLDDFYNKYLHHQPRKRCYCNTYVLVSYKCHCSGKCDAAIWQNWMALQSVVGKSLSWLCKEKFLQMWNNYTWIVMTNRAFCIDR